MSASARQAVTLGLLNVAPPGVAYPGRNGAPGTTVIADVRGALGDIRLRSLIVAGLGEALTATFPGAEAIAGVAKAGIPWSVLVADRASLPAAIVNLDGPRASGLQRQVEGQISGRRVVLVDNLISTGQSLVQAAGVVARVGGEVIGALTVVADPGAPLPFPVRSLWSLRELVDASLNAGHIDAETHRRIISKEQTQ